jgi:hypothetical protein
MLWFWLRPGNCSAFELVFIAARHMDNKVMLEASEYLQAYAGLSTVCEELAKEVQDAA